jgi:hypothetical protein
MPDENFQQSLEVLKKNYTSRLKDKVTDLFSIEEKLVKTGYDFEALKELYITSHRLAGASGMFGFPGISEEASKLEEVLYPIIKGVNGSATDINTNIYILTCNLRRKIEKEL